MIFDAHQHFWHYTEAEFGWIATDALRRDFTPADLELVLRAARWSAPTSGEASVGGDHRAPRSIAVEARQSIAETDMLLDYAARYDFIAGVTGWLPLASPDFESILEPYLAKPHLKALRHVVQDESDDAFILRGDFNCGVSALEKTPLAYEILVFQRQLANAIKFADRHPNLRMVLDHLGKPVRSADGRPNAEWVKLVHEMARRENVWCKVSGLVTEVGRVDFRPYIETVLDAFGADRVMWGSDWPVCTADVSYGEWLRTCRALLPNECFGENAVKFYKIGERK